MINKLLGATALGVVFTAGLAVVTPQSAQAQLNNPDADCRPGEDVNGNTPVDSLRCGTDAQATATNSTAVGHAAWALANNSTAIGRYATVNDGADNGTAVGEYAIVGTGNLNGTAIGQNAVIAFADDDDQTPDIDESITSNNATVVGQDSYALGDNTVAIGQFARATADYATAVGQNASASGWNSTALGNATQATASDAVALGADAIASADWATAVGQGALASGENSTAIGNATQATATDAVALGADAIASGVDSLAVGQLAQAAGQESVAVGALANASADYTTAVGEQSIASDEGATAIGNFAQATGYRSTALGEGSIASETNSTALGNGAIAGFANSTAIGAGAQALFANQFMFGTSSNTYTMPGIVSDASRGRQSGPLEFITTDASGNLASDGGSFAGRLSNTEQRIADAEAILSTPGQVLGSDATVQAIAANSAMSNRNQERVALAETSISENRADIAQLNQQFENLGLQIEDIIRVVSDNADQIEENTAGIAIANAMAGTSWLQANETHAVTANWGYYNNTNAFAFSATQRLNQNWSANMGIGFSTDEAAVGARAGLRFGW